MAQPVPQLRILSVGGNSVSAFLSWRLQATNACDVTLVWKSGFEAVSQYGISFKSELYGNERFKPRHVVRSPEDASNNPGAFDYVLLCVKALPDVYDLASVIESVVTPQHTCILVNTTHTLGIEAHLEQRFPTNVVLSLVSGAELTQLGPSEFEHSGATDVWVGPANKNPTIPSSIQSDMAEALAMTLSSGQVDCKVSDNIRQQQFERMIGPIAFHPTSVLFETPSHAALMEKIGARDLINGVVDELLQVAAAQDCSFPADFKAKVIETMRTKKDSRSIMYQDFMARRPMEIETYLGSPLKIAKELGVTTARIETLYAIMHHVNLSNQSRPAGAPPGVGPQAPRMSSMPPPRQGMNGVNGANGHPNGNGRMRPGSGLGPLPPPGMRRGPPPMNGYGPPRQMPGNGYMPRGPPKDPSRRTSMEGGDLEEFSHLVMYDNASEGGATLTPYMDGSNGMGARSSSDLALREKELMLRQKEIQLREQMYRMKQAGGRRFPPPPASHRGGFDDDDDDDEFFDPMNPMNASTGPPLDDDFDMMSVTSRRNRKAPSASQMRKNPEAGAVSARSSQHFGPRGGYGPRRVSTRGMPPNVTGLNDSLMDNPMMGYSSNRYGEVDRKVMGNDSRTNSLTAARLDELQSNGQVGPYPTPAGLRRTSQSPGNPFPPGTPNGRFPQRVSPPNGNQQLNGNHALNGQYAGNGPYPTNGQYVQPNGRPSPPGGMRQPVPRYPPGQGNQVAPQQVEQHAGVSTLKPPKSALNVRSLTGSASASAGSGDSGASANIDSENSAHSSQSSLGPRAAIGVR